MRKIVLTGGGTGGHVIPNISLLPLLRGLYDEIYYIGTNGIEKEIVGKEKDVKFYEFTAFKFNRSKKLKNITLPFNLLSSVCKVKKILKEIKPDVVFSKGGYVALPVCIASFTLHIPIVSHESDLSIGLANKLIYKLSTVFCTTFKQTSDNLKKAVYTGAPIRESLLRGDKEKGYKLTGFDGTRPIILVTGGSTGASDLNEIIYKSLPIITKKYDIIHLTGKNKSKNISFNHYKQMEYCHEIEHLFKIADIVISRAGSGAIYELLSLKKCMILVPLPKGNSRGDQVENAKYFEKMGYAKVLFQENITPEILNETIDSIYKNRDKYTTTMSQFSLGEKFDGAKNIVAEIKKVTKNANFL